MNQKILTTGDVAKFCGVTYRTVLRWIDRGTLVAYQLPGRGDHRIRVNDFLTFLATHKLPVPEEFMPSASRIMVLEANEVIANHIAQMLTEQGFEVATAHDGFKAGTLLGSFQPSVIIVDESLPCLSSGGLISHIRSSELCVQTKVLVMTDNVDAKGRSLVGLGADDVMSKPFNEDQLMHRLKALLAASGAQMPSTT